MKSKQIEFRALLISIQILILIEIQGCSVTVINNEYQGIISSIGPITSIECPTYKNTKAKYSLMNYQEVNFEKSKNYQPINDFINLQHGNTNLISRCQELGNIGTKANSKVNLILRHVNYERVYPYGNQITINEKKYVTDKNSFIQLSLYFDAIKSDNPEDTTNIMIRSLGNSELEAEQNLIRQAIPEVCAAN